jgi:hypothetical protein
MNERFTRRLFGWLKFLSSQPRRRDFRFTSTSYGVFRNVYYSPPGDGTALSFLKGSYTLFEFIPRWPESRDFRFIPTSSGEFKFKHQLEGGQ